MNASEIMVTLIGASFFTLALWLFTKYTLKKFLPEYDTVRHPLLFVTQMLALVMLLITVLYGGILAGCQMAAAF